MKRSAQTKQRASCGPRRYFLFAMPSMVSGVARLLDLAGTYDVFNLGAPPDLVDSEGVFSDWKTTGDDLLAAARSINGK